MRRFLVMTTAFGLVVTMVIGGAFAGRGGGHSGHHANSGHGQRKNHQRSFRGKQHHSKARKPGGYQARRAAGGTSKRHATNRPRPQPNVNGRSPSGAYPNQHVRTVGGQGQKAQGLTQMASAQQGSGHGTPSGGATESLAPSTHPQPSGGVPVSGAGPRQPGSSGPHSTPSSSRIGPRPQSTGGIRPPTSGPRPPVSHGPWALGGKQPGLPGSRLPRGTGVPSRPMLSGPSPSTVPFPGPQRPVQMAAAPSFGSPSSPQTVAMSPRSSGPALAQAPSRGDRGDGAPTSGSGTDSPPPPDSSAPSGPNQPLASGDVPESFAPADPHPQPQSPPAMASDPAATPSDSTPSSDSPAADDSFAGVPDLFQSPGVFGAAMAGGSPSSDSTAASNSDSPSASEPEPEYTKDVPDPSKLPVFKPGESAPDENGNGAPGDLWWGTRWWKPSELQDRLDERNYNPEYSAPGSQSWNDRKLRERAEDNTDSPLAAQLKAKAQAEKQQLQNRLDDLKKEAQEHGYNDLLDQLNNCAKGGKIDTFAMEAISAAINERHNNDSNP